MGVSGLLLLFPFLLLIMSSITDEQTLIREGYSIIGQGKIDEILSVKSGERREVFEEAAGISKYRHRKEESERKLQRTEENLVRINDKIAELELQVEPLRRQAETAKKYLVLRDELRVLEISVWLENLQALKTGALKLRTDFEAAQAEGAESVAMGDDTIRLQAYRACCLQSLLESLGLPIEVDEKTQATVRLLTDPDKVQDDVLKNQTGASAMIRKGKNVQVVYGLKVNAVRKAVDAELGLSGED